jgi:hypothetical protein
MEHPLSILQFLTDIFDVSSSTFGSYKLLIIKALRVFLLNIFYSILLEMPIV